MEGTLEELRRISNCPEGATFSQLGLRKSVETYRQVQQTQPNSDCGGRVGCNSEERCALPLGGPTALTLSRERRPRLTCLSASVYTGIGRKIMPTWSRACARPDGRADAVLQTEAGQLGRDVNLPLRRCRSPGRVRRQGEG